MDVSFIGGGQIAMGIDLKTLLNARRDPAGDHDQNVVAGIESTDPAHETQVQRGMR